MPFSVRRGSYRSIILKHTTSAAARQFLQKKTGKKIVSWYDKIIVWSARPLKQLRRSQIGNIFYYETSARLRSRALPRKCLTHCTRQVGRWDTQPFSLLAKFLPYLVHGCWRTYVVLVVSSSVWHVFFTLKHWLNCTPTCSVAMLVLFRSLCFCGGRRQRRRRCYARRDLSSMQRKAAKKDAWRPKCAAPRLVYDSALFFETFVYVCVRTTYEQMYSEKKKQKTRRSGLGMDM